MPNFAYLKICNVFLTAKCFAIYFSFSFIRSQSLFISFGPGRHERNFTVENFSLHNLYVEQ